VLFFKGFHHGPALLKFAQGGAVYPYPAAVICRKLVLHLLPDVFSSPDKQSGFVVKLCSNAYSQAVKENTGIVQQQVDNSYEF
jgi:hypothetical protein